MANKWALGAVIVLALGGFAVSWALEHVTVRIRLDDELAVNVRGEVPFRANLEQPIEVGIDKDITAKVKLGKLPIQLDEHIDVPLDLTMNVPIDDDIRITQPLDLSLQVPIDTVLTERELDLSQLVIPIDTDVFIDDTIDVDMVVPIDTSVTTTLGVSVPVKANIPVKMKVPIHQKVRVRDSLKLGVKKLRVPLKMTMPVHLHVPLDQSFRVRALIKAPVKQTVTVPLHKTIEPSLGDEVPVTVSLSGQMPAQLKGALDAKVEIHDQVRTHLGDLHIAAKDLTFSVH